MNSVAEAVEELRREMTLPGSDVTTGQTLADIRDLLTIIAKQQVEEQRRPPPRNYR